MNKQDTIIDTLEQSNYPLNISEMADILGFNEKDITDVVQELQVKNLVISPKENYYTIKS